LIVNQKKNIQMNEKKGQPAQSPSQNKKEIKMQSDVKRTASILISSMNPTEKQTTKKRSKRETVKITRECMGYEMILKT